MNIQITVNRKFRSFKDGLTANDLNDFIVLTGKNGAGKSQLLQIIEGRLHVDRDKPPATADIVLNGQAITLTDTLGIFDWGMPSAPSAGMAELQSYSQQIHQTVNGVLSGSPPDENLFSLQQREEIARIATELRDEGYNQNDNPFTVEMVVEKLSANFSKKSAQIINERIASITYDWHLTAIENREPFEQESNPITIFNELAAEFETKYQLPPFHGNLRLPYVPLLENRQGDKVNWNELSSGEQVLFRIICWLFYYRTQNAIYPKLLVLDEPDAHLTPKMIHRLLDNLQRVIIDKMGISVIMTTHSPNTVALCEETALYELLLSDSGTRTIEQITRKDALVKFSEGLLFVQEDTRLMFVEGKDDLPFYDKLYRVAIIRHDFKNIPSLKFIAASHARPEHGGCTKVLEMVPRFNGSSIENLVHGIIDNDNANTPQPNISVLDRYSIESYLYDPLLMAVSMLVRGKHDRVPSLNSLQTGDQVQLMANSQLVQNVINDIINTLKTNAGTVISDSGFSENPATVKWKIKDQEEPLSYTLPEWYIKLKGKALVTKVIRAQNSLFKDIINNGDQYVAIETIGAVPLDIYEKLTAIQIHSTSSTD